MKMPSNCYTWNETLFDGIWPITINRVDANHGVFQWTGKYLKWHIHKHSIKCLIDDVFAHSFLFFFILRESYFPKIRKKKTSKLTENKIKFRMVEKET